MKTIVVNKKQFNFLNESFTPSPYETEIKQNVKDEKAQLENFIEKNGEYMIDITNNKTYMVQYLKALSELVGKPYAMCAPMKSDGTYGAFYVKPYSTFKKVGNIAPQQTSSAKIQRKRQPNLYQRMAMNNE